ncbi:MAG TPA: DUF2207 domain-containing protein [Propionibacteriaceae bacterium]|nr:DUF2207 domain-containing protein [Propionibacteriaceae bacterium]
MTTRVRRPAPPAAAVLLTLLVALAWSLLGAAPAHAATEDQIDSFRINYEVRDTGVVRVTETITYRFGDNSGRHGIERYLIVREPYDEKQDAVYEITQIDVSSPDPGIATQWSRNDSEAKDGREVQARLRIGDPDETISADIATYVIAYDLSGAIRTSGTFDEFYWDATGLDWTASIKQVDITASVPGGVQDTTCTYGPVGSTNPCTATVSNGVATYRQSNLAAGEGVTISAKITAGLIADNAPHLEPDGSKLSPTERVGAIVAAAAGLVVLIGSPLVGVLWWRKHGRDQRYAGLAPGTTPLAGQPAHIVPNDPDLPIPVAFSPPRIPVAEAGLLVDGQVDARETAATIIDLAVRGALRVQSSGEDEFIVILIDPDRAAAPHEMVLLTNLFGGQPPGATVDLSERGSMLSAHQAMQTSVRNQVAERGWFRKVPSGTATGSAGFGVIALGVFGAFTLGAWVLWILIPLLPIIITIAVIRAKLRRGQRTADGRAVCDQVEGFRTYLATAEADQLKFEEGEDIFSKYLPWAIIFELADRWAKICGDLVAMGRLPDTTPYWYVGNYHMMGFNTGFLTSSLTSAATPAPSAGSSGTGFGGGSSFSGGGFSGGGGGGGGGGSW